MKLNFLKKGILASLLIISVLTIFIFSSCNKEDMNDNETVMNDDYYVKYVIYSIYPRIFSNWSVTTPEGKYMRNDYQTRRWEQTYGPVKKGFRCEVVVASGEPTIEIYASKNQREFALKTTQTGKSAGYNIDF